MLYVVKNSKEVSYTSCPPRANIRRLNHNDCGLSHLPGYKNIKLKVSIHMWFYLFWRPKDASDITSQLDAFPPVQKWMSLPYSCLGYVLIQFPPMPPATLPQWLLLSILYRISKESLLLCGHLNYDPIKLKWWDGKPQKAPHTCQLSGASRCQRGPGLGFCHMIPCPPSTQRGLLIFETRFNTVVPSNVLCTIFFLWVYFSTVTRNSVPCEAWICQDLDQFCYLCWF